MAILLIKYRNNSDGVIELSVPQQQNGYDCGVYVSLFAEVFAKMFSGERASTIESICGELEKEVTPQAATNFRRSIVVLIGSGRLEC